MATASKRLTRKQLRRPDQFLTLTNTGLEYFQKHQSKLLLGLGVFIAALLLLWAWQAYKAYQDTVAAQEFGQAVTFYQEGRYREALAEFEKVQGHHWSRYATFATLYEANTHIAMNNLAKAMAAAERVVQRSDPNSLLRQAGLLALAYAEERQDRCKEAIRHYSDADKIAAPLRERALLGKARCYRQSGDPQNALAAYRQFFSEHPASPAITFVTVQVAELESKVSGREVGK